ncbi:MAG: hypothetical protein G3M78_00895 [Candidatus Nitrohelix vancouverensis]|uniref:J domain-containing protein n=1 Tax=Candidatus Nitrohelix vancouverensis TaxID=2705534 RepID=A0A7T0G2A4_9BACT|nr:MAG: hypothetical protein G3M78_00895 [Candidatus Nitrohelix vancouverensis]
MFALSPVASPESEELEKQRQTLSTLEQELMEKELEITTSRRDLKFFEKRYQKVVGVKYAELDALKAEVLDFASKLYPKSDSFKEEAESARESSQQAEDDAELMEEDALSESAFRPSDDLKKLFRQVAKKIHPDLASDGEERKRRHELMARLNRAYDRLDDEGIRAILIEWEAGDHSSELSPGARLARTMRQVAQVRKRIHAINDELDALFNSAMHKLKEKVEFGDRLGKDLLQEMAGNVDEKISRIKARVRDLADDLI